MDPWSAIASEWQLRWGSFAHPAWATVLDAAGVRAGQRVLDVGCGSGELLAYLQERGTGAAGIDPAPGMVALARAHAPAADVRLGGAESLPWADDVFDLTIAVNAVQLADDTLAALREMARVTAPGGHVAIVTWADRHLNDLDLVEQAVAEEAGDEPVPDGDLRVAGGLERLLSDGGLTLVAGGLVEVPWEAADDDALVRGVLLGEDDETIGSYAPVVVAAARPFRVDDGGYRLVNRFRFAVGCVGVATR